MFNNNLFIFTAFEAQKLEVTPVTGSLGSNVTLTCLFIHSSTKSQINQVQWDFMQQEKSITILVFHHEHGMKIHDSPLMGRVNISEQSLTITDVKATDQGSYICKIVTFPTGSFEAMTTLTIVGE